MECQHDLRTVIASRYDLAKVVLNYCYCHGTAVLARDGIAIEMGLQEAKYQSVLDLLLLCFDQPEKEAHTTHEGVLQHKVLGCQEREKGGLNNIYHKIFLGHILLMYRNWI